MLLFRATLQWRGASETFGSKFYSENFKLFSSKFTVEETFLQFLLDFFTWFSLRPNIAVFIHQSVLAHEGIIGAGKIDGESLRL